jgi:hypothetical protein
MGQITFAPGDRGSLSAGSVYNAGADEPLILAAESRGRFEEVEYRN